jgi:sodium transport system permease protein
LTVTCFSICTALLNLVSMQLTASMLMRQFARVGAANILESLGPLPLSAIGWLVVILLPMSALFSALALAVAAMARSSKEGQYYLMPLLLVGMPLVMLPMLPGMKLGVGTCVLPVTGAVLLARAFIEGQYHEAWTHVPFVVFVTVACCMLSVRWAVRQFESESVLFRENERFGLSSWIRHLWRDRELTASPVEAILCGLIILVALFFGRLLSSDAALDWPSIARSSIMIQLGMVLAPCLIMATILTRSLRYSLGMNIPRPVDFLVCVVLAICLHPTYTRFVWFLEQEYTLGSDTKELLQYLDGVITGAPLLSVLMALAVFPAICEELAFRGFIFGGLKNQNGTLRAILISSVFFGFSHGLLQQSIAATVMGLVLGVIAWKTGGVLCGMAFHVTHNALSMSMPRLIRSENPIPSSIEWAFTRTSEGMDYSSSWLTLSVVISIVCMVYIVTRKERKLLPAESTQESFDFPAEYKLST